MFVAKQANNCNYWFASNLNPRFLPRLAAENYIASQTEAFFYWRDAYKCDVDFICADGTLIIAQEVKYKDTLRPEDFKNLISFADKFSANSLEILAKFTQSDQLLIKDKTILIKPIWNI